MWELDETPVPPCKLTFTNKTTPQSVMSHAESRQIERVRQGNSLGMVNVLSWIKKMTGYIYLWCNLKGQIMVFERIPTFLTEYVILMFQTKWTIYIDLWCQIHIYYIYFNPFSISLLILCLLPLIALHCLFFHNNVNRLTSPNNDLHTAIASIWFVDACCRVKHPLFCPPCSSCTTSLLLFPLTFQLILCENSAS